MAASPYWPISASARGLVPQLAFSIIAPPGARPNSASGSIFLGSNSAGEASVLLLSLAVECRHEGARQSEQRPVAHPVTALVGSVQSNPAVTSRAPLFGHGSAISLFPVGPMAAARRSSSPERRHARARGRDRDKDDSRATPRRR
ncbi:hypothetical protein K505DRAFT_342735 [Melanomma pulvis-pyrius CBS 109.77]|uniref:Uncharacterized protein n=1 Tax=Melanomma pulvis-pyrius CBS 109.77 TaxID=1314802 RepID=A0A6A6WUB3_9PLEO|nr:hypothetical protein K505DRAFT_342735 [Melanomma pulvis-pyrius CBS 109.77]